MRLAFLYSSDTFSSLKGVIVTAATSRRTNLGERNATTWKNVVARNSPKLQC